MSGVEYKKPKKSYLLPQRAVDIKELNKSEKTPEQVSTNLQDNIQAIEYTFKDSLDFILRKMNFGTSGQVRMALAFLETLTDKQGISDFVLEPLNMLAFREHDVTTIPNKIIDILPAALKIEEESNWKELEKKIVTGHAVLFIEGYEQAIVIEARKWRGEIDAMRDLNLLQGTPIGVGGGGTPGRLCREPVY